MTTIFVHIRNSSSKELAWKATTYNSAAMLWLQLAAASRRLSRPSTRSFAELVPIQSTQFTPPTSAEAPARRRKRKTKSPPEPVAEKPKGVRVPVREDHGLYAFFRRKTGDGLTGEDRYEVAETPEEGKIISGICDLSIGQLCFLNLFFKDDLGKPLNSA
jgi:hypothetical protein